MAVNTAQEQTSPCGATGCCLWLRASELEPQFSFFWHQGLVSRRTVVPRTGGKEDGSGMIPAHYIYCVLDFYDYSIVIHNEVITQLTVMQNQAVMQAVGSSCKHRWSFACSHATHQLPCGLALNRSWTSNQSMARGFGTLDLKESLLLSLKAQR